jgi:creatinase
MSLNRPDMYRFHNGGKKDTLPFADQEYHDRLAGLREIMELHELDAVVLTSMHNVSPITRAFFIARSGGRMPAS